MVNLLIICSENLYFSALWQQGWVNLAIGMAVALSIMSFYQIRIKGLRKRSRLLVARAEEYKELYDHSLAAKNIALDEAAKSTRLKDEFEINVSREIRTAMNGIFGMVSLLKETTLTKEQKEWIAVIQKSGDTLLSHSNISKSEKTMAENSTDNQQAPPVKPEPAPGGHKLSKEFARHFPLSILIAEDDSINRHLALTILKKLGYEADFVTNGQECLEIVGEKHYDLILMDVLMPEMDGLEATKMIRLCLEIQPYIIAMTASALEGDREKCLAAGMNEYVSKPINIKDLMRLLEQLHLASAAVPQGKAANNGANVQATH